MIAKRLILSLLFLAGIVFLLNNAVYAQYLGDKVDKKALAQADDYFQEKDYPKAMQEYSHLLSLDRDSPFLNYRFGVSYLFADRRDTEAPIRYLQKAKPSQFEANDSYLYYYYMGMAYHLNYMFIEAMDYYTEFQKRTPEKTMNKIDLEIGVERLIEMAKNGLELLGEIKDIYVFNKIELDKRNFYRSYAFNDFGGKLLYKPNIFKTKIDNRKNDNSIVFLSDKHNIVFFSSYGDDKNNSRDIYYSVKDDNNNWGEAVRLSDIINTSYDEDYPYLLPDGKTLYFSSKGHNSMGGYDIFKSVFDSTSGQWSQPKNVDFAINTPFDDILFVTDKNEQFAFFSSNRESIEGLMTVYKVRIDRRPRDVYDIDFSLEAINVNELQSDSNYLKSIALIKEKSKLDINAQEEDFEQKIYVDEHKLKQYKIPRNIDREGVVDRTFNEIDSARQSLNYAKAKRDATYELLGKKKSQAKLVADNLALNEEIALLNLMTDDFQQTIAERELELDQLLGRAGYIQQLATARQLDSSLVLLIDFLDNIKNYEEKNYSLMESILTKYIESDEDYTIPSEEYLANYMMEEVDELRDKAQELRKEHAAMEEDNPQKEKLIDEVFSLEQQAREKEKQAEQLFAEAEDKKMHAASGDLANVKDLMNEINQEYALNHSITAEADTALANITNESDSIQEKIPRHWPEELVYEDYNSEQQAVIIEAVEAINHLDSLQQENEEQITALLLSADYYLEKTKAIEANLNELRSSIDTTSSIQEKENLINEYRQLNRLYSETAVKAKATYDLYTVANEGVSAGPDELLMDKYLRDIVDDVNAALTDDAKEKIKEIANLTEKCVHVEDVLNEHRQSTEQEQEKLLKQEEKLQADMESEEQLKKEYYTELTALEKTIEGEESERNKQKLQKQMDKLQSKINSQEEKYRLLTEEYAEITQKTNEIAQQNKMIHDFSNEILSFEEKERDKINTELILDIEKAVEDFKENKVMASNFEYYPEIVQIEKDIATTSTPVDTLVLSKNQSEDYARFVQEQKENMQEYKDYISTNNTDVGEDKSLSQEEISDAKAVVVEQMMANLQIKISKLKEEAEAEDANQNQIHEEINVLEDEYQDMRSHYGEMISTSQGNDSITQDDINSIIQDLYRSLEENQFKLSEKIQALETTDNPEKQKLLVDEINELKETTTVNEKQLQEFILLDTKRQYYDKMQEMELLLVENKDNTENHEALNKRISIIAKYIQNEKENREEAYKNIEMDKRNAYVISEIKSMQQAIIQQNEVIEEFLLLSMNQNTADTDTASIALVDNNTTNDTDNNDNTDINIDTDTDTDTDTDIDIDIDIDTDITIDTDSSNNSIEEDANNQNIIHFSEADTTSNASDVIPVDLALPDGLIFKVQFAALRRELPYSSFPGIEPITGESSPNGFIRYLAGSFTDLDQAYDARETIRGIGYEDAFVVAYLNGERINVAEARRNIDSRETTTDLIAEEIQTEETKTIEESSALYYTVQVGVYGSTRTSDRLFGISPLIEERLRNGNYRYFSGYYNNREEATAWRNEIRDRGVTDAFVVAVYNGERISVAEADRLREQGVEIFSPQTNESREESMQADTLSADTIKEEVFYPEMLSYYVQIKKLKYELNYEQFLKIFLMNRPSKIRDYYIYADRIFAAYLSDIASANQYKRLVKHYDIEDLDLFILYASKRISLKKAIKIKNYTSN